MEHKSKLLTRFGATALALVMTFTLMLAAAFAASGSYTKVSLTNAEAANYGSQLYTLVNGSYEEVTVSTDGGVKAYVGNDGNTYSADQVSDTWTDDGGNTWSCVAYSTSTAYDYYVTSTLHTYTRAKRNYIYWYYVDDSDSSSYSSGSTTSASTARDNFCSWVTSTYGDSYVGDCRNNGDNYYAAAYIPIIEVTTAIEYTYTYDSGSVTSTGADNTADIALYTYEADAEAKSGTFTVATINVDGLPETILGITVNSDGPGSEGTEWISSYINDCGYDIVAVEEDFEYNEELLSKLTDYSSGTWRGNISDNITLSLLTSGCIDTDGLNLLYKSAYTASGETWVSWTTKNGRLDNGNDELIDKGYRFYQVTIADGVTIDVYTMHMDADSEAEDIAAREAQWTQLVKAIKASNTTNPIIVMGDTNSRYTREDLQTLVIDALDADSRFTVADAWIEVIRNGDYPEYGSDALTVTAGDYDSYQVNEVVDKVLYINNANSNIQLTATSYEVDEDDYKYDDGSLPGDHPPVVVEFSYTEKEIETPECEHSYVESSRVEPTCTENGSVTYTCSSCGESYTEVVPYTGHSYGDPTFTWAEDNGTCTAAFSCKNCSDTQTVSCTVTSETTAATCTEDGEAVYTATCTFNSKTYTDTKTVTIEATGHTAGEAVKENEVAATCTEDGSYDSVVYCSVCGEELSRETVTVPATGHSYEAVVTEPTCTEGGYTTYTCSVCGDSYVADETEATGHTWDEGVVTKEATCTEDGVMTYTCTVCGETKTEAIEATGHSYEAVVTAPTCTEKGYTTYTCTVCGDSYTTDETEATGHTAGETVTENEVAATCTEDGSYDSVVYCTVCEAELSRETVTVPATGHSYGEPSFTWAEDNSTCAAKFTCATCGDVQTVDCTVTSETTAATCTEAGETVYTATCTFNSKTYTNTKTVTIEATGHTAGEAVKENEVAATCTEDGSYDSVVYCTVCGAEISRETITVSATGHTAGEAVKENEVAATCTEDGSYDKVVYCTVCNEEISRETVTVPATGHSYEAVVTAPTCTEGGYTTYTCSVCGDSYTADETEAIGHSYTSKVTKEATCTESGEITYTCSACGDTYTETISAKGHSYESVVTAPTCTEQGYTTYTCSACGDSYVSNYVEALGHSYDEGVVTKAATCTEDGVMTYTCTVCGETKTEAIAATGHTAGEAVVENEVAATCTEDGSYDSVVYCTVCGEEISRETVTVEATGHTYVAVVTAPTCTEKGYTTYTCSVCGDSYTADETAATGHTTEIQNAKDATCTEDGYTGDEVCTVCGETVST
ncbi:MAG: hypothetical protein LUE06_00590, partial [Oscillospiraceae bacterium]|nr:hypothetical protein [Oscillospiraceae bacterium]